MRFMVSRPAKTYEYASHRRPEESLYIVVITMVNIIIMSVRLNGHAPVCSTYAANSCKYICFLSSGRNVERKAFSMQAASSRLVNKESSRALQRFAFI
mmetsp:Transcript_56475/g.103644  ORF Transcript_56475/g.103644 Transcript_56475/m.103644 type:complete len:98 (+) Transcript_56475:167-460(+)